MVCSSIKFTFGEEGNLDNSFTVNAMISLDGVSLDGSWSGVDKGDWCAGEGDFEAKLLEKKKKEKKVVDAKKSDGKKRGKTKKPAKN